MTHLHVIYTRLHALFLALGRRSSAVWDAGRQWLCHVWQHLEAVMTPLSERPLLCLCSGMLGGSGLGLTVALTPGLVALLLGIATVLCLRWPLPPARQCCRLFYLGFLLTHLHALWLMRAVPLDHIMHVVATQPSTPLTVDGIVARPIAPQGDRQRLYLQVQRIEGQHGWQTTTGLVRLSVQAPSLPFLPGDVLRITRLRLHAVRGFQNPRAFNFQRFMQRQGLTAVAGVSNPARLSLLQRPAGFAVARLLEQWRQRLHARIHTALPAPYDAMFLAMVLGHGGQLPATVEAVFRQTGTAHLLVASGLNIGFIAAACMLMWRPLLREVRSRLPRAWLPGWRPTPLAILLLLPPLLLYWMLVGGQVPIARAALMIGCAMLAVVLGRTQALLQALLLAAALILLYDPAALFAPAFQLSFVAVASILLAGRYAPPLAPPAPILRRWCQRGRAVIVLSSAAYFGTLPILASLFHTLPIFGIPANLVLVPLASLLVPAGVLALGLISLWPALSPVLFPPLETVLRGMLRTAEMIAQLPGAELHVPAPSWVMLLGYYGSLTGLLIWPSCRWRLLTIGMSMVLFLAGLSGQYLQTRVRHLRVTFLDVGSGDAILVQTPSQHAFLIDGGGTHDGRFDIGRQVIAPFLWNHYVRRFELMAITHPEANHARGLVSVLRLFPTRHLLTNGSPLTAPYFADLAGASRRWRTQQQTALDGHRHWQWERLRLTVLAPPSREAQQQTAWKPPTENDRSLVLRLQYGTVRLLLTGDIQHFTERWLLANRVDLQADILQVPHHGSKTSTLPDFVHHVRPQVAIISLGAGNPYGHPHAQVLSTLANQGVPVFRTDHHGAITVTSDGTSFQVVPFRPYRPPLTATGTSPP
jgi:competence protein ComEC